MIDFRIESEIDSISISQYRPAINMADKLVQEPKASRMLEQPKVGDEIGEEENVEESQANEDSLSLKQVDYEIVSILSNKQKPI